MKKIAALLITVFVIASFGFTPFPKGDRTADNFGANGKFMEELKLSDAQQTKINDFRYSHKKEMIETKAEIEKNRLELSKMLLDNNIDENKILGLTEANNTLRSEMNSSRTKMWLNIYKILNNDQQKLWAKHKALKGERMHNGFRQGRGKHSGPRMGRGFRGNNEDGIRPRNGKEGF